MSDGAALTVPPAGWYPDRNEANLVRWWDGQQWTDQTQSTAPAAAAFEQPVSAAAFGFADTVAPADAAHPIAPGWYQDNRDPSLLRWWDGTRWTTHTTPAAAAAPVSGRNLGGSTRPVASRGNTMATLALAISIVSFAGLIFVVLLPLALAGVIMGIVALRRIPMYPPGAGRRGQAVGGIVVGAISLIVTIVMVVAAVLTYEQVHPALGSQTSIRQSSPQTGDGTTGDAPDGVSFPSSLAELKSAIATSIERQDSVVVTTVTCDAAASMVSGSTFECGVLVSDGRWTPIRVDIRSAAESGMSYGLEFGPLLSADELAPSTQYTVGQVEQEVTTRLSQAWGSAVSGLDCDSAASTTRGSSFRCDVSLDDGSVGAVMIVMVDPGGYDVSVIRAPADAGAAAEQDPELSNS